MGEKEILLSVIITVYNLESYIGKCLESLVLQSPKHTEIIVVDDGSCDGSKAVISQYAEKYPSLIKAEFLEPPGCMGRAHKRGYELARGKYCQFIDGDDWLEEDAFERIFSTIEKEEPDVIMAKSKMIMEEGSVPFKDADIDPWKINGKSKEQVIEYLTGLSNFHMFFWRYVFKKENVLDLLDYAIDKKLFLNDWLPAAKILLSGEKFVCLEEPFYDYRQRQSSSVSKALKTAYPEACFFTFLEFVNLMSQRAWNEFEKKFIYSRAELLWEMAIDLSDLMKDEQFVEVAAEIDRFEAKMMTITANQEITKLQKAVSEKGSYEGLCHIAKERKEQCLNAYKENKGKRIYIFPTGQKAEYAARVLQNAALPVEGFFDNDPNKDGIVCEGLKCSLPSVLEKQKDGAGVMISTIWPKAYEAIYAQLVSMGMNKEDITRF